MPAYCPDILTVPPVILNGPEQYIPYPLVDAVASEDNPPVPPIVRPLVVYIPQALPLLYVFFTLLFVPTRLIFQAVLPL